MGEPISRWAADKRADKSIQFLLMSAALFSYQILMSTYLSSSLAGQPISLIVAPTYLAFALAVVLSLALEKIEFNANSNLSFLTLLSLVASILFINSSVQDLYSDVLTLEIGDRAELGRAGSFVFAFYRQYLIRIALLMSLPFFFYGLYFSNLLKVGASNGILKVVSLELGGASLGVLFSLFFLSYFGWGKTFSIFFLAAALPCLIIYLKKREVHLVLLTLLLMVGGTFSQDKLSPVSNLHISARDFQSKSRVELVRESWNYFSKVQTLKVDGRRSFISMGDGVGIARMPALQSRERTVTTEFTSFFRPKKVLILFAGAGYELVKFSEQGAQAPIDVTGVEINSKVIEHGLLDSNGALEAVLKLPGYRLVQADARQFLESDDAQYDAILFSWSGATLAYYSGAIMHTTQYVFTRDALSAARKRLAPGGQLLIFGGSKANVISHLKALNVDHLKSKIALLEPWGDTNWKRSWDNHILIFSESAEALKGSVSGLSSLAKDFRYSLVLHPQMATASDYLPLEQLILSENWQTTLAELNSANRLFIASHTDDNPFVYQLASSLHLQKLMWHLLDLLKGNFGFRVLDLIIFIFVFVAGGFGYVLFLSLRRKPSVLPACSFISFYFGLFATALQFFCIYKSVLFLGFPNFALGLALVTALSSSLICFLVVRKFKISKSTFFLVQVLGFASLAVLVIVLQMSFVEQALFRLPLVFQLGSLAVPFTVVSVLNGIFYPYFLSLQSADLTLAKQIIVFDVLGCALGSLLVPLVIEDNGISLTMLAAATLALVLLSSLFVVSQRWKMRTDFT